MSNKRWKIIGFTLGGLIFISLPLPVLDMLPPGQLVENQLINRKMKAIHLPSNMVMTNRNCGYINGFGDVGPQCTYAYDVPGTDRHIFEASLQKAFTDAGYQVIDDYHTGEGFVAKNHGLSIDVGLFPDMQGPRTAFSTAYSIPVSGVGITASSNGIGVIF